jgi:hypothetical protein
VTAQLFSLCCIGKEKQAKPIAIHKSFSGRIHYSKNVEHPSNKLQQICYSRVICHWWIIEFSSRTFAQASGYFLLATKICVCGHGKRGLRKLTYPRAFVLSKVPATQHQSCTHHFAWCKVQTWHTQVHYIQMIPASVQTPGVSSNSLSLNTQPAEISTLHK